MNFRAKSVALIASLCAVPVVNAQFQFDVKGRHVQIHSFGSQGFAVSSGRNNYLTMQTSRGSFAMTDGGANISTQLTDKLRVGAQMYTRNIGNLGNFHPELDWAMVDYRFKDWFGVRVGKVKTSLGLYNDTQDMEFLHTWAILPQSMYPLDMRALTIAHKGGDFYGNFSPRKLGTFSYTAYAGRRSNDPQGGYVYGLKAFNNNITSLTGYLYGADLRWNTPIAGLIVGSSLLNQFSSKDGSAGGRPYHDETPKDNTNAYYVSYTHDKLKVDGEYRRQWYVADVSVRGMIRNVNQDMRTWYTSLAYRLNKRVEVGTYHSRFYDDFRKDHSLPTSRIFDQTVSARVDVNSHVDLKLEQHFIDGTGSTASFHGFYVMDNPKGMAPKTNMFVVRLGFNL